MGSLPLRVDARDYDLRSHPGVAAALAAGTPDSASIMQWVTGPSENQGSSPACVAASSCNASAIDDQIENGQWEMFDWMALYREAGGDGTSGVDSRTVLQILVDKGAPLAGSRRKLMGSYAFVPQQQGVFDETIKAAIVAGQPVTLALLLPIPFGWNSGTVASSGYHQIVIVAYDPVYWIVFNSWGDGWPGEAGSPRGGIGRVRRDYVSGNNFQQR